MESEEEAGEVHRVKVVKGLVGCAKELKLDAEQNQESLKGLEEGGAINRLAFEKEHPGSGTGMWRDGDVCVCVCALSNWSCRGRDGACVGPEAGRVVGRVLNVSCTAEEAQN